MQLARTGAGGDDDGGAFVDFIVFLAVHALDVTKVLDAVDGLVVKLRAGLLGLLEHLDGEFRAIDDAGAGVVGDLVGVDDIAAGGKLVEHNGLHVRAHGVNGRSQAGGAGTHNHNIVLFHNMSPGGATFRL